MKDFFMFQSLTPAPHFSPEHIMWLTGAAGLVLWVYYMGSIGYPARRSVGQVLLICEASRVLALFFAGELDRGFLPLHLCGAAVYACTFHSAAGGALLGELIYSTLAPGALIALLFPDWLRYSPKSFIYLSSFGIHILICAYGTALLAEGFRPQRRRLGKCLLCLVLYAMAVAVLDKLLDVNYLFLAQPAPGSPLEWAAGFLPWHGLIYPPALAAIWMLLYNPWVLRRIGNKPLLP
ncbi:MAG: YwaF family protein [Candidatus Heteroscillospira sp.]|jgi:uncharacterized membrane protein YwaF